MPELIAKPALEAAALTLGGATLALRPQERITALALFPGGAKPVTKALKPLGLGFPAPGESQVSGAVRILWTGRDQAFLFGAELSGTEGAAVTDQSDGWAGFDLAGPGAEAVLARLVALDLRPAAFGEGRVARAALNHMALILRRSGAESFELYVFRSMARTAWHELEEAMTRLAARAEAEL